MGMTNDPISDMLTRIRNASAVNKAEALMPYSKLKHRIAEILHQEGYLGKVSKVEATETGLPYASLRIGLRYDDQNRPMIRHLKRVSKPGLRIYKNSDSLPVVLNNLGIAIVSTSQGIMTNRDARKKGVGGEVICEIY